MIAPKTNFKVQKGAIPTISGPALKREQQQAFCSSNATQVGAVKDIKNSSSNDSTVVHRRHWRTDFSKITSKNPVEEKQPNFHLADCAILLKFTAADCLPTPQSQSNSYFWSISLQLS